MDSRTLTALAAGAAATYITMATLFGRARPEPPADPAPPEQISSDQPQRSLSPPSDLDFALSSDEDSSPINQPSPAPTPPRVPLPRLMLPESEMPMLTPRTGTWLSVLEAEVSSPEAKIAVKQLASRSTRVAGLQNRVASLEHQIATMTPEPAEVDPPMRDGPSPELQRMAAPRGPTPPGWAERRAQSSEPERSPSGGSGWQQRADSYASSLRKLEASRAAKQVHEDAMRDAGLWGRAQRLGNSPTQPVATNSTQALDMERLQPPAVHMQSKPVSSPSKSPGSGKKSKKSKKSPDSFLLNAAVRAFGNTSP